MRNGKGRSIIVLVTAGQRSTLCPSCAYSPLTDRGALPPFESNTFGGHPTDAPLEAGHLLSCVNCGFYFRHPQVSQEVLTRLYRKLPPTVWESDEPRPHWPRTLELMERYSPNRVVLDVGCFSGDFLSWLPDGWRKMGVEPGAAARQKALSRGIELVGEAVERIDSVPEPAGIVILFDLLEHLTDPFDALAHLKKFLAPEGSLIVLTGAADTLAWKIFGSDYWYCALPEHVSFFTLRWFRWASRKLGLSVVSHDYLSSEHPDVKQACFNFIRLLAYASIRRLRRGGVPEPLLGRVPLIRRVARWKSPPWWRQAKDHILIVLKSEGGRLC